MARDMQKINVLIIGAGHYSTGTTSLTGVTATDKDLGVLLPSVLALKQQGVVDRVGLVATDGTRLDEVVRSWKSRAEHLALQNEITCFP